MSWKHRLGGWLRGQWYDAPAPHPLLLPLETLFRQAVAQRRRAYRDGLKPVASLPVPVIVVGNLSVGGTGKTPLVIWLAEFLTAQGFRPGIISRGYGGTKHRAPLAVNATTDPARCGDEPALIAQRTGCPVYVFPQRVAAARALLAAEACDVILSDDGLQHYALGRDIEIAVIDGARGFGNGHCLPAGPLREPPERLASVDFRVYSGAENEDGYAIFLAGDVAVNLHDPERRQALSDFAGSPVYALAGIGHPERFFDHLRRHGLKVEGRGFPDHHPYRPEDLRFADNQPLLMTEKDAVKCRAFAGPTHWYLPVTAQLSARFGHDLLTLLKAKCDERKTA